MKRPLAYITAAWCGEDYKNTEQAARYCRAVYEAGFSPICPTLYLPLFLNDAVPEEHKSGIDMSRDLLRRSHVLVVCGQTVTEAKPASFREADEMIAAYIYFYKLLISVAKAPISSFDDTIAFASGSNFNI